MPGNLPHYSQADSETDANVIIWTQLYHGCKMPSMHKKQKPTKIHLFCLFHQFTYSYHTNNMSCSNLSYHWNDQQLRYHCHHIKLTSFGKIFLESHNLHFSEWRWISFSYFVFNDRLSTCHCGLCHGIAYSVHPTMLHVTYFLRLWTKGLQFASNEGARS